MSSERWGGGGREGMTRLGRMFPTLTGAPGLEPWDPEVLMRWSASGATHGAAHAVAFLLNVWNANVEWREVAAELGIGEAGERFAFNCAQAIAYWDSSHREAFLVWCEDPFYP